MALSNKSEASQNASLEEQLDDDQAALKRMVIILSLVGGLGLIAIVTTIVIFTRIKRRKHDKEPILQPDEPLDDDASDRYSCASSSRPPPLPPQLLANPSMTTNPTDSEDEDLAIAVYQPQPSAPDLVEPLSSTTDTHARLFLPLQATAPQPSAPPAKLLAETSTRFTQDDANVDGLPELPPPAYTPSPQQVYNHAT
ncbi:hypothetical protein DM01DRAFT_1335216 [Hesseltinella vesiculosa]|uniref:Uncharacterized protein n=1 Tax=Hesseltinella vesiculosa TaxID=101127 RepID=A0A1X2GIT1_9FUNG|nr:hypothetical protein DM01DRAFT_1335216 [Hesseltinella vesiculosa]